MQKKSIITLIAIAALVALSIMVYYQKKKTSTLPQEARAFNVEDTAAIDEIFLVDKNGRKVLLERISVSEWRVDGGFPARPDAIATLLYTIKMVDVKSPVANAAKKNIIKKLATNSIKVEIYQKGELVKQYYVGDSNQEHNGTYMLLTNIDTGENYEDPFVTHIPGFEGYLTTRYFTEAAEWRDRLVLNYTPPQLKSVKFEFLETPDSSFVIDLQSTNSFTLRKLNNETLSFDELKMKQYLAYFQNVNYEKLLTDIKDRVTDSLKNAVPYMRLSITPKDKKEVVYNFFHKKAVPEKNIQYGIDYKYDPDRLFMKFNNDKDLAVIQFYVFGKLFQSYRYFLPATSVKK